MNSRSLPARQYSKRPVSEQHELRPIIARKDDPHHREALAERNLPKIVPVTTITATNKKVQTQGGNMDNERFRVPKLAADILAILIPLTLLIFMVAVKRLDGKRVDQTAYSTWADAITIFATLFPIVFASIIGRFVYEVARWKLEIGSTMQALEQLIGSRSVGSAMTTQLQLGIFNVLGISLLLVWAFSPLGSQSILRILKSSLNTQISTSSIMSYDNLHATGLTRMIIASPNMQEGVDTFFQYLTILLSATLMTPKSIKTDTMDQWRNVKIPFLDSSAFGANESAKEWQKTTLSNNLEYYTSVAGIPIVNIPFGNTTLSIESNYIELDCYNVSKQQGMPPDMGIRWDTGNRTWIPNGLRAQNGTWQGNRKDNSSNPISSSPSWGIALDNFVDNYWVEERFQYKSPDQLIAEADIHANPTRLLLQATFRSDLFGPPHSLTAICNVRQRYIESRVICERTSAIITDRNCTVLEQRPSQKPHTTDLISHLNFPDVWSWIVMRLPESGGGANSKRADLVMQYLNDPKMDKMILENSKDIFNDIDNAIFSRRLSQIFNTYLLLSQLYISAPGGSLGGSRLDHNITANVTTTTLVEVYIVSHLWITLGILSCCVLLLGGVLSVIFRHLTIGPEVLGYASSVVRDSKHINLPPEITAMSGMEITKVIRDQRIRYGFTESILDGKSIAGVGLQGRTKPIRNSSQEEERLL